MISIYKYELVNNEHLYGPGKRLLIFLKGCKIHCKGCINKHLWYFKGGHKLPLSEFKNIVKKNDVEGITLHGGEPLDQAHELLPYAQLAKSFDKTIILFTGYLNKELDNVQRKIWALSDLVISGRFLISKKNLKLQFRGSTNQKVFRHKGKYENYKLNDGYTTAIISVDNSGAIEINGFYSPDIDRLTNNK